MLKKAAAVYVFYYSEQRIQNLKVLDIISKKLHS
jgi:hypothetical protein